LFISDVTSVNNSQSTSPLQTDTQTDRDMWYNQGQCTSQPPQWGEREADKAERAASGSE